MTQLAHDPILTKDFHGLITGNVKIPFPFTDSSQLQSENDRRTDDSLTAIGRVLELLKDEVAGIIVEPLQGAGGHRMAQPRFFQGLSELAHRFDTSLGFDEVQTAGGQTGTIWAIDQFDLPHPPQAVASAKKLGNGVVYMIYPMDDHGILDSTWGGSLVDMVRLKQEMKIIREEKLMEQVAGKSQRLGEGLDRLAARPGSPLYNPRGMGLYQGFSLRHL